MKKQYIKSSAEFTEEKGKDMGKEHYINESLAAEEITGLTDREVEQRVKEGKVNYVPKAPSRTFFQILRANLFTGFNAVSALLAAVVILIGSYKNALFVGIIIVNTAIGVVQEVRAKKILEKLSVISTAKAKVVRNGKIKEVKIDEVVLDDILYLDTGMQIIADAEVIEENGIEIDESMLTGESDAIHKNKNDKILSGSFVTAGDCYAKVTGIGKETYSYSLAEEARQFKITNSELQKSISKIFKGLLCIVIPLTAFLVISQIKRFGITADKGWLGIVSSIIGMIPEGMILLTSATFVVSVIKLSEYNTLVQELCATEVLARVDVLCLDKTGTITQGDLKLSEVKNIGKHTDEYIDRVLALMANNLPSNNATQKAILNYYNEYDKNEKCITKIPFSSKRKWGAAEFENEGSWILGAPEVILGKEYNLIKSAVEEEAKKGKRVLLLANFKGKSLNEDLKGKIESAALILIEDIIREAAPEVLKYFDKQGVTVKIISGDSPVTVSEVARRAGVKNWNKYMDARELPEDEKEFKKTVNETTVFGRVTPHQKKKIVMALQEMDHTVAMTGDGVNDVLALKTADCGIAMANASDATKAVAQLVLMDSDFSSLPKVLEEGRKQINNIERVSELFLSKTVYSILLAFICALTLTQYFVTPLQLSLVGSCAIGIPGLFLALLPTQGPVKKGFLHRVLAVSIPNGIITAVFTAATFFIANACHIEQAGTLSLLVFAGISLIILFRVSRPLTTFKTVLCLAMFGIIFAAFTIPLGRMIFDIDVMPVKYWLIGILIIISSIPFITKFVDCIRNIIRKKYAIEIG